MTMTLNEPRERCNDAVRDGAKFALHFSLKPENEMEK
jgi:hypothetical protein